MSELLILSYSSKRRAWEVCISESNSCEVIGRYRDRKVAKKVYDAIQVYEGLKRSTQYRKVLKSVRKQMELT